MKNFCLHLVSQYKMDPSKVKIMGVIISGKKKKIKKKIDIYIKKLSPVFRS